MNDLITLGILLLLVLFFGALVRGKGPEFIGGTIGLLLLCGFWAGVIWAVKWVWINAPI